MTRYFAILFVFLLLPAALPVVFGTVNTVTTDKSVYYDGEILHISGTLSSESENPIVSVVVFDPQRTTFVTIGDPTSANIDGSFSTSLTIGGPLWTSYGDYPVQVTSEGSSMEVIIEYKESSTPEPESEPTPEPESEPTPEPEQTSSEPKELGIASFVDESKDPQHYVDRYNNESTYKEWFDANYPQYSSIYEAVGLEAPVPLPTWIQDYAGQWATGAIPDSTFVTGIEFLLENNIIMISNISSSQNVSDDEIPDWVRNNALWWSQDLISEDEFVSSLEFLIQESIIVIN